MIYLDPIKFFFISVQFIIQEYFLSNVFLCLFSDQNHPFLLDFTHCIYFIYFCFTHCYVYFSYLNIYEISTLLDRKIFNVFLEHRTLTRDTRVQIPRCNLDFPIDMIFFTTLMRTNTSETRICLWFKILISPHLVRLSSLCNFPCLKYWIYTCPIKHVWIFVITLFSLLR